MKYTKSAVKDIEGLDSLAKKRIEHKILELKNDTTIKSRKLINSKIGEFRYRIGDYRVVFDIEGDKVIILRIVHRKEIYR